LLNQYGTGSAEASVGLTCGIDVKGKQWFFLDK